MTELKWPLCEQSQADQSQSALFGKLPGDIRNKIFTYALQDLAAAQTPKNANADAVMVLLEQARHNARQATHQHASNAALDEDSAGDEKASLEEAKNMMNRLTKSNGSEDGGQGVETKEGLTDGGADSTMPEFQASMTVGDGNLDMLLDAEEGVEGGSDAVYGKDDYSESSDSEWEL